MFFNWYDKYGNPWPHFEKSNPGNTKVIAWVPANDTLERAVLFGAAVNTVETYLEWRENHLAKKTLVFDFDNTIHHYLS